MKAMYVGNCTNSFDDDGDCELEDLPWSTVSDFAFAVETATRLAKVEFEEKATISTATDPNTSYWVTDDGVYIIYDEERDVHYFYT